MPVRTKLARGLGKALVVIGHAIVISLAVLVPLAVVWLGSDPVRLVALSLAVALVALALILAGDVIADSSGKARRALPRPVHIRRHSLRRARPRPGEGRPVQRSATRVSR